jgi:hypothetical protein
MGNEKEVKNLEIDIVKAKIFIIRTQQVMLDKDIAALYGVKPIRLREQVQRNIERFHDDFMFQLTESEVDYMVSQNAIPSRKYLGGTLPYVFTEQGVASLAGVLRSAKAAEVHVKIMRAFVEMRHPTIELREFEDAHDRFLIIDESEIYHIGASLKDLGKKWFAFSCFDSGAIEMLKKLGEKKYE